MAMTNTYQLGKQIREQLIDYILDLELQVQLAGFERCLRYVSFRGYLRRVVTLNQSQRVKNGRYSLCNTINFGKGQRQLLF